MIAYLTVTSAAERAALFSPAKYSLLFVNRDAGESYGEAAAKGGRRFVRDKREARAACKLNNATPWNF